MPRRTFEPENRQMARSNTKAAKAARAYRAKRAAEQAAAPAPAAETAAPKPRRKKPMIEVGDALVSMLADAYAAGFVRGCKQGR